MENRINKKLMSLEGVEKYDKLQNTISKQFPSSRIQP